MFYSELKRLQDNWPPPQEGVSPREAPFQGGLRAATGAAQIPDRQVPCGAEGGGQRRQQTGRSRRAAMEVVQEVCTWMPVGFQPRCVRG